MNTSAGAGPLRLARSTVRRVLAVLAAAPMVLLAVTALTDQDSAISMIAGLAAVAVAAIVFVALRRATHRTAEIADGDLDERERGEVREALRIAYSANGVMLGLLFAAAMADRRLVTVTWEPLIAGAIITLVLLPSAIVAWRQRDLTDA
ncbi:hypothetical protein [Streptosporangium sandarakinum]|uniref:Uncharacterized protein n=1 Tax=Streptosporangium sandarakinum TaxID=1260955 RepID=A0A852V5J9_9ACTN|nr:hypothetical protein [Streptosporangium sandarakinum]NYF41591.1 hypothetical protein [Streptosporangium sandarakinum]